MGNAMLPIHTGQGKPDLIGISSKSAEPPKGENVQTDFMQILLGLIPPLVASQYATGYPPGPDGSPNLLSGQSDPQQEKSGQAPGSPSNGEESAIATIGNVIQADPKHLSIAVPQQQMQVFGSMATLSNSTEKSPETAGISSPLDKVSMLPRVDQAEAQSASVLLTESGAAIGTNDADANNLAQASRLNAQVQNAEPPSGFGILTSRLFAGIAASTLGLNKPAMDPRSLFGSLATESLSLQGIPEGLANSGGANQPVKPEPSLAGGIIDAAAGSTPADLLSAKESQRGTSGATSGSEQTIKSGLKVAAPAAAEFAGNLREQTGLPQAKGVQTEASRTVQGGTANSTLQPSSVEPKAPGIGEPTTGSGPQPTGTRLPEVSPLPDARQPRPSSGPDRSQENSGAGKGQADAPELSSLPQGAAVNASSPDHELNDALTGKNTGQQAHVSAPVLKNEGGLPESSSTSGTGRLTSLPPDLSRNVVDQVVKNLVLQLDGKISEMRLTLKPESLGEVGLKVRMEEGKMQAQIDVSQVAVKAAIESSLPELRQALSTQGIDLQRIDVFAPAQSSSRDSGSSQGDRPQRRNAKNRADLDAIDSYDVTRDLGYNTIEMVI